MATCPIRGRTAHSCTCHHLHARNRVPLHGLSGATHTSAPSRRAWQHEANWATARFAQQGHCKIWSGEAPCKEAQGAIGARWRTGGADRSAALPPRRRPGPHCNLASACLTACPVLLPCRQDDIPVHTARWRLHARVPAHPAALLPTRTAHRLCQVGLLSRAGRSGRTCGRTDGRAWGDGRTRSGGRGRGREPYTHHAKASHTHTNTQ